MSELHKQMAMKRSRHPSSSEDSDNGSKPNMNSAESFIPGPSRSVNEVSTALPLATISQVKAVK